jgi:hypothetical protein
MEGWMGPSSFRSSQIEVPGGASALLEQPVDCKAPRVTNRPR